MKESAWSSNRRTFKVSVSFLRSHNNLELYNVSAQVRFDTSKTKIDI